MTEMASMIHRLCAEAFNGMNVDLIDRLYAPDSRLHGPVFPEGGPARQITRDIIVSWRRGMPDCEFRVEDIVEDGDKVAVRWSCTGTHTGVLHGVPGSGRAIRVQGLLIAHLRDGKVQDIWQEWDTYAWFKALGASPVDILL